MNTHKFQVALKAMPFLGEVFRAIWGERHYDHTFLDGISFRPADANLMQEVPWSDYYDRSAYVSGERAYYSFCRFFVIFEQNGSMSWKGLASADRSDDQHGREEHDADNIGDQLAALDRKPAFLVQINQNDPYNEGNYQEELLDRRITICKMAGYNLAAYLRAGVDRAATELQADITRAFGDKS